jgi:putative phosphoesterase
MAKYLTVFSDSHGQRRNVSRLYGDASVSDKIVFLGDGLGDLIELFEFEDKIVKVAGNCDFTLSTNKQAVFEIEGVKFLAVHGDLFGVKSSLDRLTAFAIKTGVNAVLFGHTHKPLIEKRNGITLINPGTLSNYGDRETFAFITVKNGEVEAKIIPLCKRV